MSLVQSTLHMRCMLSQDWLQGALEDARQPRTLHSAMLAEWWSYHNNQMYIAVVTAAVESVPYQEVEITIIHANLEHSHLEHGIHKVIKCYCSMIIITKHYCK